ncbi:glycosyltransferase family 4 protein [Polaribacter staleyi]|uniref:glycosyltransferase family 4 protein n=1 Tax=Polaribacter staleyi TaxID=2022337 RepID=UPI0031BA31F1
MHICFLTNEYPKQEESHGGIGTFVKFLAENLVSKGVIVSILGINNSLLDENTVDNKVSIYRLGKSNWKFGKFYHHNRKIQKKLKEIHLQNPIDIVEGSELNFSFFPNRTPYKKLIRLHGGHHFFAIEQDVKPALWRGFQEKKSFKNADHFIAVTDYVGYQTQKYLNLKFEYTTIHNGINLNNFYESDVTKETSYKLLFVGTVCEKKGIKQLIETLPFILKKYPNTTLEIIGRDWFFKDGTSYIEFLKTAVIKGKGLEGKIKFTGGLPYHDLPKHIESAHVCIYPSFAESFGLTLIEGMVMGKLVAASTIAPFKEIVGNSNVVSLFDPIDRSDMSEKIVNLLSVDKNNLQLRQDARKHVLTMFSTEAIIAKNIQFYKKIK